MDEQMLDDRLETIYSSSVPMHHIAYDLLGAMDDRDGWQERVRVICAGAVTL